MTPQEFALKIKTKYPEYKEIDDVDLNEQGSAPDELYITGRDELRDGFVGQPRDAHNKANDNGKEDRHNGNLEG